MSVDDNIYRAVVVLKSVATMTKEWVHLLSQVHQYHDVTNYIDAPNGGVQFPIHSSSFHH